MGKIITESEEQLICDEYLNTRIGIESLSYKYHISKKRIKEILDKNGIPHKSRGGQNGKKTYVVNDPFIKKYVNTDTEEYVVIDEKNENFFSKDIDNRAGHLTTYIEKHYGVKTPPLYARRLYYMETGNYWHEQWLTYEKVPFIKTPVKKCPYCDWTTKDVKNLSGAFLVHLKKAHNMTRDDYLRDYPEDTDFIRPVLPHIYRRLYETNEDRFVTCQICKQRLGIINAAHLKTHGMTVGEYQQKYGYDSCVCKETHDKLSKHTTEYNKNATFHKTSKGETEVSDYMTSLNLECRSDRHILGGREIDILILALLFAIEFDGTFSHNEKTKDDYYHLRKTEECLRVGIFLIHIFADEWERKQEICKSMLAHLTHKTLIKIPAKKCVVKRIDKDTCYDFMEANSIFGSCEGSVRLGTFYNDQPVSVMVFKRMYKNPWVKGKKGYNMTGFCHKTGLTVVGGMSKMLAFLNRNYTLDFIVASADRRWSNGKTFETLGFKLVETTKPQRQYVGRHGWRILKYSDIPNVEGGERYKSIEDYAKKKKLHWVCDCGSLIYLWEKGDNSQAKEAK